MHIHINNYLLNPMCECAKLSHIADESQNENCLEIMKMKICVVGCFFLLNSKYNDDVLFTMCIRDAQFKKR